MATFSQDASIQKMHNNVLRMINEKFPIENKGFTFEVSDIQFKTPEAGYEEQDTAFAEGTSLETVVRGTVIAKKDGEVVATSKNVVIVRIPYVTERGTYIINGNEMTFLNQMNLRPGIYVNPIKNRGGADILESEVRAGRKRFRIALNTQKSTLRVSGLSMEYGKDGKEFDAISFLKVLGATDEEIQKAIGDKKEYESIKKNSKPETIQSIYSKMHSSVFPGNEEAKEKMLNYMQSELTFDDKAKKVSDQMIGASYDSFGKEALLSTLSQMFKEFKTPGTTPNVDDIRFKEISSSEDIIARGVDKGIREWVKRLGNSVNDKGEVNEKSLKPVDTVTKGVREIYQSDLGELVDSPNPLDLHQKKTKLTMLGYGGLNEKATTEANRNLQDTAFAKIDPVETPQSLRMGLVQYLARDAEIKDGKIYSKFYKVNNGEIDKSKVIDDLDPLDEFDEYIAFYTPESIEKKDGKLTLTKDKVKVRHKGKFIEVDKGKVTLIDCKSTSHLSDATNLIPFGAHNDGSRMLMGASMQKQSLSLEDPDEPLVQSISDEDTGKTIEEEVADNASYLLRAPAAGKISSIGEDFIEIEEEDGTKTKVKKLNYFSTGKMGGYIHHKPVVKTGDMVEAGDLLADGWQSKNGKLALGKNTLVAYMPYEGYNFEDGVVVSESFARKMSSEEIKTLEFEIGNDNIVGNPEVKKVLKITGVSAGVLRKLDEDGVIKKGEKIANGDIFVGSAREKKKEDVSETNKTLKTVLGQEIFEDPADRYNDTSKYAQGYQKGTIIDVKKLPQKDGGIKVFIKMLSFKPMEEGDKLAGRHGNKGTITKILPDAEMPQTEDGQPVELIFSPLAVPSRKNLGQLLEVNAGLVAQKKGMKSYNVNNFDSREREKLMKELEEVGVPDGKMTLINPATGQPYESKITVGPMYIMKLKHKVEGKITQRSIGKVDKLTQMPKKVSGSIDGDRHNPQSVGGMEFWSLTSAGAVHNIHEMTTLKSDGAGDREARLAIFRAIRRGESIPDPVTPETLKVLSDQLMAAGVQVTPLKGDKPTSIDETFTSLMLQPLGKEFRNQIKADDSKEILESKTFDALKLNKDKKGLYSERIFGADGDQWGKISLVEPMPNPLYLSVKQGPKPYEVMLKSRGFSNGNLVDIVEKGHFVIMDPGESDLTKYQIIDLKDPKMDEKYGLDIQLGNIKADTGASALNELLKEVDLKEELEKAQEQLKNAKNLNDRSKAQERVRLLAGALDHGMTPQDFMMDFVPVLPVKYREPVKTASGKGVTDDGITRLYQSFMQSNKKYKEASDLGKDFMDSEDYAAFQAESYARLKNIVGVGEPFKDPKTGQELKGIMHTMSGKKGYLRDKMQSKKQDYSGRSVIVVDPNLNLDEVSLPEDMAAEIFKPHVQRELEKERYSVEEIERIMENRTEPFRKALTKASENHPVILNRQPSLHRHSLQAFYPKIRWNEDGKTSRAIGINAMVTTGFNADFDGDTMAVHVPITDAAIKEAKEKLMPSQNLYNPTNGSLIMELKHEMQLGIYYMTRNKAPEGTPKDFRNEKELQKAYEKGEVKTYDSVRMDVPGKGVVTATAGQHLFNACLPPAFRDFEQNKDVGKKRMNAVLTSIINDPKYGATRAVESMNKLQHLGFKAATVSGVSIGVKDFDGVLEAKAKVFDEAAKEVNASNFIDNREMFEQKKIEFAQKALKNEIGSGILESDNPVSIMMNSGARGNAGQVNAMAGIVGAGRDVTGKGTRAVASSHLEGLSPDEFWSMSYDSRKGIYDRSVATRDPGALTRQIWMANKQTVISEKDCGTKKGIELNMEISADRQALRGRILLNPIKLQNGRTIQLDQKPITLRDYEDIKKNADKEQIIKVRSPLTCESSRGVCQMCYGARAGAMRDELVPIGDPIGSLAAQALGEPSQQAIMKTFHTGAGASSIGGAFERIEKVLTMPKNMANKTILVQKAGTVTNTEFDPIKGWTVTVDKKKYELGHKPLAQGIRKGVEVQPGDNLNQERMEDADKTPISFRDPREVFKFEGADAAQNYLLGSVNEALEMGDIGDTDRRHVEVAVSNMLNRAVIEDPGTSKMTPGQTVTMRSIKEYNKMAGKTISVSLDHLNKMNVIGAESARDITDRHNPSKIIVKKGEIITEDKWETLKSQRPHIMIKAKPIQFTQQMHGVGSDKKMANQNWLESAAYQDATNMISRGSAMFMNDKLDNPLTRQMSGLKGNFGEGFKQWENDLKTNYSDFL